MREITFAREEFAKYSKKVFIGLTEEPDVELFIDPELNPKEDEVQPSRDIYNNARLVHQWYNELLRLKKDEENEAAPDIIVEVVGGALRDRQFL